MKQQESNEDKKEYLNQYRKIKAELRNLEEQYKEIRLHEIMHPVSSSGMPVIHDRRDLSDYVVELDNVYQKYIHAMYELVKKHSEIFEQIKKLDDPMERAVLNMRYIRGMTWERIAAEIKYSWKQTHRIHSEGLKHFEIPAKDDII